MEKNHNGWSRISHQQVFTTPVFKLFCERSKCLRTGSENDFYYFNCRDWVNIIAVTPADELIMIKQYRHGNNHLELEVPGGCIDADDLNPESAAARELLEETGYQGKPGIMIGKTCPNPALQNNWCHTIFIADAVKSSKALMEDTEDIQTLIIPLKDIGSLIDNQEITHGLVLNAIHFYERFAKRHIGQ